MPLLLLRLGIPLPRRELAGLVGLIEAAPRPRPGEPSMPMWVAACEGDPSAYRLAKRRCEQQTFGSSRQGNGWRGAAGKRGDI